MHHFPVNVAALAVAAVVRSALACVWFSSLLFGPSASSPRRDIEGKVRPGALVIDLIANLAMAFVFLHILHSGGSTSAADGAAEGLFYGIGLLAVGGVFRQTMLRGSLKEFIIDGGFQVLTLVAMGAVLAAW